MSWPWPSIYSARAFAREEPHGLANRLRRRATSAASNIAEGRGRGSDADFGRYLQVALGSAGEAECQLSLARESPTGWAKAPIPPAADPEAGGVVGMRFGSDLRKVAGRPRRDVGPDGPRIREPLPARLEPGPCCT